MESLALLDPRMLGPNVIVCDPVVKTSATTPASGEGSTPSTLEESFALAVLLV